MALKAGKADFVRTRQRIVRAEVARKYNRGPRRGSESFSYAVADSLRFLNGADWDALAAGQSIFMSRAYQEVLRNSGPRSLQTRYGLVYAREKAVAAVVAHIVRPENQPSSTRENWADDNSSFHHNVVEHDWIRRTRDERFHPRSLLICGDPFVGGFQGVAIHESMDMAMLWPAIAGFLERVQLQARFEPERDCVIIKDIPATISSDARALRTYQYRRLNSSSSMHFSMPTRWKSYEDYVEHLNIRHRMGAYRVARDVARAGIEARNVEKLAPLAQRIHSMYLSVQQKGGMDLGTLPADFFPALTDRLGNDAFRCTGLYQRNELVAFVITIRNGDQAVCYGLGWDRERCAGLPVLPALLHAVIGNALDLGCHEIDFGRTALKAKAQVGAHPHASETWVQQSTAAMELPGWLHGAVEPLSHSPVPDPVVSLSI